MLETKLTQTYRIACDRCGKAPSGKFSDTEAAWHPTTLQAHQAAEAANFHFTEWVQDGCPRQLWLCDECFKRALKVPTNA